MMTPTALPADRCSTYLVGTLPILTPHYLLPTKPNLTYWFGTMGLHGSHPGTLGHLDTRQWHYYGPHLAGTDCPVITLDQPCGLSQVFSPIAPEPPP